MDEFNVSVMKEQKLGLHCEAMNVGRRQDGLGLVDLAWAREIVKEDPVLIIRAMELSSGVNKIKRHGFWICRRRSKINDGRDEGWIASRLSLHSG